MNRRLPRRRRLFAEPLEARLNMATLTVNSLEDTTAEDASLTLREALALVNSDGNANAALVRSLTAQETAQVQDSEPFGTNDTIVFDAALVDSPIGLNSRLTIARSVSIDGANRTTIDGNSNSQHFFIDGRTHGSIQVKISSLRLRNGSAEGGGTTSGGVDNGLNGGSIFNDSALVELNAVRFLRNDADVSFNGGAIYNLIGTVIVRDSVFSGNTARSGAAIFNNATGGFASVSLFQSTVVSHIARGEAALYNRGGSFDIVQSTLANNSNLGGGLQRFIATPVHSPRSRTRRSLRM